MNIDIDARRLITADEHAAITDEIRQAVTKALRRHRADPIKNSDRWFWITGHCRDIADECFVVEGEEATA